MNWIIISIGMALVLALAAAVVGPMVVDWNVYRAAIETEASRALGVDVRVGGNADIRLLPSPKIHLTDVALGPVDAPIATAGAVEIDVALSPLLTRELRILNLTLAQPDVTIRLDGDGQIRPPALSDDARLATLVSAADVAIDDLIITDGTLRLEDERTGITRAVTGLSLTGQFRSLFGPFNLRGEATVGGHAEDMRIAGGTYDPAAGTIPLSVRLTPGDDAFSVAFDGNLAPSLAAPKLSGTIDVSGAVGDGTPLSLSGAFALTPDRVSLARAPLRYGTREAELELATTAIYRLAGNDPLIVTLETRQVDLDRIARHFGDRPGSDPNSKPEALRPPRVSVPELVHFLDPLKRLFAGAGAPDTLAEVNIGTVVLGGSVVRDLSMALRTAAKGLRLERAEALLPGDTAVDVTGRFAGGFEGRLRLSAPAPAALMRWWSGIPVDPAAGANDDPLRLDARLLTQGGRVEAPHFNVRLGQSSASGRVEYAPADTDGRATVTLSVGAPFLDTADLLTTGRLIQSGVGVGLQETDMVVDVRVERMRVGEVEGSAVNVDAQLSDGTLTVDALYAEDLAGAEFLMSGDISNLSDAPVGIISGSLQLKDGARLGEAVRGLFPADGRAARIAAILARAVPGRLDFSLSGGGSDTDAGLRARATGDLAGTRLSLDASGGLLLAAGGAPLSLTMDLNNAEATALLAQLGVPEGALQDPRLTGPLTATLDLDGPDASQLFADLSVSALGTSLHYEGGLSASGGLGLNGAMRASADDLDRIGVLLGRALPVSGGANVSAELATDARGALTVSEFTGTINDAPFEGDLSIDGSAISGRLAVADADIVALSSAILGVDAWTPPAVGDGAWPTRTFGTPLLGPIALDLDLSAETLALGPQQMTGVTGALSLSADALSLSNLSGALADGAVSGSIRIARDGTRADLAARLMLNDADLGTVGWSAEGTPVATGRIGGAIDVTSAGVTIADLVAGLSGSGSVSFGDVAVERFNPAPFDTAVLDTSGDEPPTESAVLDAVRAHLAGAALAMAETTAPLDVSEGTLSVNDMRVTTPAGQLTARAALDLPAWEMSGSVTLAVSSERTDRPGYTAEFAGPLNAPERRLDVSALAAWLSLVQLEGQVLAVEEQNQELAAEADAAEAGAAATTDAPNTPETETPEAETAAPAPSTEPDGEPPAPPASDAVDDLDAIDAIDAIDDLGAAPSAGGPAPIPRSPPAVDAPNPAVPAEAAPQRDSSLYRERVIEELRAFAGADEDAPRTIRDEQLRRASARPFALTPADIEN